MLNNKFPVLVFLALSVSLAFASESYKSLNSQCDGLPQLPIGSYQNTCVGMLADSDVGFIKPRKAVQLNDARSIIVTDMGGWNDNRGILWLLKFNGETGLTEGFTATKLMTGLSLPHDIEVDEQGWIYVGEADQIFRFKLVQNKVVEKEVVVSNLPFDKNYLHPLTNFAFLSDKSLLVNVGSRTDHCEGRMVEGACTELNQNGLWRYEYDQLTDQWRSEGTQYASGLRNSMALAVHSTGTIVQAENSSDLDDAGEPYEELNVIKQGGFYGWPYCLNENFDQNYIQNGCEHTDYVKPMTLIPPHTAPLDMAYVKSERLPMINDTLLMSWHGYRVVGNRVVFYPVDGQGLPVLSSHAYFNSDPIAPETTWQRHAFEPKGGFKVVAQPIELIHRWNAVPGLRPEGAPVGMTMLNDGSLLIVDDKNKQLLRMSAGVPYTDNAAQLSPDVTLEVNWTDKLKLTYVQHCAACHMELLTHPELLMNSQFGWLDRIGDKTLLEQRLFSEVQAMPLTGTLTDEEKRDLLAKTLNALKGN